ncbi:MAG: lytic transglycosylase domain-containing protein [Paracoccaceae bacterium]
MKATKLGFAAWIARIAIAAAVSMMVTALPARAGTWFWDDVPAKIADGSRSGAIQLIRTERAKGRAMFGSKDRLQRMLSKWRPEIEAAARHAKVSEALIAAVVLVESGGNPRAVSPAGAQGLGQLMPGTARRYGVRNSFDPGQNLKGAAAYLSDLLTMFRGDLVLVLAAYNAGEGAVNRFDGVPPYRETRNYVPKVLAAFDLAGQFCATPPRAARRKCQFRRHIR